MVQRLLLIDDDPALRMAMLEMLKFHFPSLGVTAVESAATGIQALIQQDFDVVLCDLLMPGMDGIVTIAKIKSLRPDVPAYLMTGHPEPETVYREAQADGFIKKPIDRETFLTSLKRILAVSAMNRTARDTIRARQMIEGTHQRSRRPA